MKFAAPHFPILALALAVTACSSQIDSISAPVVATSTLSPGGIYIGQDSSNTGQAATTVIALVNQNQDLELYAGNGSYLLSGLYSTTTTNGFSAQARDFQLNSSSTSSSSSGGSSSSSSSGGGETISTVNLVGSFAEQSQILASYTNTDGEAGSYNLSYQPALYQVPSTLATLAGTWVVQDAFGAIIDSFSINSSGSISGTTAAPQCSYSGQASIIDLRYNIYGLTLSESCITVAGSGGTSSSTTLNGLATLLPAASILGNAQSELVLTGASTSEGRLFILGPPS